MKFACLLFAGSLLLATAMTARVATLRAAEPAVQPADEAATASPTWPATGAVPLQFRRVYVPESQLDQFSSGGTRWLPMDKADFERMAGQVQRAPAAVAAHDGAAVVRAVYSARLSGDELTDGEAALEIRAPAGRWTSLALDPCRLAIESVQWLSAEPPPAPAARAAATTASVPQPPAAILGVGADGKLALRAAGPGTLRFHWSLHGSRETGGTLVLPLQLPPSPSIQLRLQLPADLVPSVEQGFVSLLDPTSSPTGRQPTAAQSQAAAASRQWQLDLGGQNQSVLRVARHEMVREHRPLTLVRQTLAYDVSARGLQLSADLNLDILGDPIRRLTLLVDEPLELVTARVRSAQVPWTIEDAGESAPGAPLGASKDTGKAANVASSANPRPAARRIVLEFAEPLQGSGRILRLGAVAPLPTRGRLPTLRPAPDGVFWQEGDATLLVPKPLELAELRLQGARQTKVEPLGAPLSGETLSFQYFRPDADVSVVFQRQTDRLEYSSGTSLDVRGNSLSGRYVADITASTGECFDLTADVAPSWIIDTVDSVPAGAIAGWHRSSSDGVPGPLLISLSKSIRPDRPMRLVVSGRWRHAPLGQRLKIDELQLAQLRQWTPTRRLVAVQLAAPLRFQLSGGEGLQRLDSSRLAAADRALLGDGAALAFIVDDATAAATLTIASQTPRFSANVEIDLRVHGGRLEEAYSLSCTPVAAAVDRLLVQFSRERNEALRWSIDDAADRSTANPASGVEPPTADAAAALTARRLTTTEKAAAGLADAREVWEVVLRQAREKPFTLRTARSVPLVANTPIALAWLAQAEGQQGTVAVRATADEFPEIKNGRLKPLPVEPPPADGWPTMLAAFQYDTQDEFAAASGDPGPALSIGPSTRRPDAWAWSCRLDTHYSPDGATEHVACWRIENFGRTRVAVQLPRGTTLNSAWIDDVPTPAATLAAADSQSTGHTETVGLELPVGRRFVSIVLHWTSSDGPLGIVSLRTPELPQLDLPVLARRWYVWLPPRCRLSESEPLSETPQGEVASWSRRLFGPLGRAPGAVPFNPVRALSWAEMVRHLIGRDRAWTQAEQFLAQLAAHAALLQRPPAAPKDQPIQAQDTTWGELLASVQVEVSSQIGAPVLPLLIDAEALTAVGLSPRSMVRLPTSGSEQARNWPFAQADLLLLVAPRALLVTTRSSSAAQQAASTSMTDGVAARVAEGPLAERLAPASGEQRTNFPDIATWTVGRAARPWPALRQSQAIDSAGWVVYQFELSAASLPRIVIVRHDVVLALGCGLFLLAAMLVWWLGGISWRAAGMTMIAATALALLLPGELVPLGTGLWLGLVGGWCLRGLAVWDRPNRPSATPRGRPEGVPGSGGGGLGTVPGAIVLLLGLCVMSGDGAAAHAAPPAAAQVSEAAHVTSPATSSRDVPVVLIPCDDQQQPKGNVYLVPQTLYDALHRRFAGAGDTSAAGQWLISTATYRGGLTRDAASETVGSTDWQATYELETFVVGTHVRLPFGGPSVNLLPDGVRLDGRPLRFTLGNGAAELSFRVPDVGRHTLELAFRPTLAAAGPMATAAPPDASIDFSVLPLATARLELTVPAGLQVEVAGGLAESSQNAQRQGGRITGLLGSTDRLTVRWTEGPAAESKRPVVDVDELFWLRVRPGSVVLETRLDFHVIEGKLTQVRLLADPRLRRLPQDGAGPVAQIRTEQGDPHTIYVGLSRPIGERARLKLSFLLTDTSGIGNLRVPLLDAADVRATTRRLAVSVESPLEFDPPPVSSGWKSLTPAQFVAQWGPLDAGAASPQLAYQLRAGGETSWSLPIHSRQPQLTCGEQLAVTIDRDKLSANWLTDLSVHGGSVFQIHLTAPQELAVAGAWLRQPPGDDVPLRWSRAADGLTLFLPSAAPERAQILIKGSLPCAVGEIRLPALPIDGAQIQSRTVLVLRRPSVQVTLANPSGLQPLDDLKSAPARASDSGLLDRSALGDARLAWALSGKPSSSAAALAASVRVSPNSPRITAVETTTVRRNDDTWLADVDLDLQVAGGVLDTLHFELPPNWKGPTRITPDVPSQTVKIPGESLRILVLRPLEPIAPGGPGLRLHLSGLLATGAGEPIRVPDVRPLGLAVDGNGSLRRFVLLPTHSGGERLSWQTRGLSVEPLPASFAAGAPPLELYRTAQVVGPTFDATLKSIEQTPGRPQARLADIAVAWPDDSPAALGYGVATFALEPAGSPSCVLETAENCRLVHVSVNDVPVEPRELTDSTRAWNIALASSKLPQRIAAVFTCSRPLESDAAASRLAAPVLLRMHVEETLWTVVDPAARAGTATATDAAVVTPLRQDLVRLQAGWQLLDGAAPELADDSREIISRWLVPWTAAMQDARAAIRRQVTAGLESDPPRVTVESQTRTIDDSYARLARRLKAEHVPIDPAALTSAHLTSGGAFDLWQSASGADLRGAAYYVHGFSRALSFDAAPPPADEPMLRWSAAFCGAVLMGLFFWLGARPAIRAAFARRPQWLVALGGIFWWLFLVPSLLGLTIAAVSAVAALRAGRRRRRAPLAA